MKRETVRTTWAAAGGALYGFGAWCLPFIIAARQMSDVLAVEFVHDVLVGIAAMHVLVIVCWLIAWAVTGGGK